MATEIVLKQVGNLRFECSNSSGKKAIIDGPKSAGGTEDGVRPMELLLMGLAGCSSMDVLTILRKQKQQPEELEIRVAGERNTSHPKIFTEIIVQFFCSGTVDEKKLCKAVDLSMEKYCSVAAMLGESAKIRWTASLRS